MGLVLPLTKLVHHCDIIFFEGPIDGLSYCSVTSDELLQNFIVLLGLFTVTLVVFSHVSKELVLFLLDKVFYSCELTLRHLMISLVVIG
jgi:hypothetical protein